MNSTDHLRPSTIGIADGIGQDELRPVHPMRRTVLVTALYAVFAALWIYGSDRALVLLFENPERLIEWSIFKGLAFVLVTSALLGVLVWRTLADLDRARRRLAGRRAVLAAHEAQQAEIERLSRLYSALGHVNQAIVRIEDRDPLFAQTCMALVAHGGFDRAWIASLDGLGGDVRILASAGEGALPSLDTGTVAGGGVPEIEQAGIVLREGRRQVGLGESGAWAAFPIRRDQQVSAMLGVHSDDAGFFRDRELALLEEVAGDLAFALENLRREANRRRAEATAHSEMAFSDAMIESMPGIVYFYDGDGRFLRWNRNFETMSGYSPQQIATMHPLDFFIGDDRNRVEQRIAEVFEAGEASVEADFVSRGGKRTAHLFTGRRVVFDRRECLVGMGVDISRRREAEQAQARLAAIVDSSRDAIIGKTLDGGIVTSWNPGAEAIFGYSAGEMIGRPLAVIVPPEYVDEERRHRESIARGETVDHFESVRVDKAGRAIDVAITLSPIVDAEGRIVGASSIAQDIGARKLAERALRASEERFRSTLDNILEGCQLLGFDWRYLYVNAASAIQNRRSNSELLGRTMPEAWPGIEATDLFALLRACMEDRSGRHEEIEFTFPDGQRGWFDVRCQPVPEGLFVLSIDISERKHAELALLELNETLETRVEERTGELQAALVRAEAADRIKSAFLATMSHELRTPLNSIIGFTGILLQGLAGPLNAEQQRQLGMVRGSARHLLELINDVLDLSKIEAGQLEVRAEDFDVAASVERVISLVQPLADRKQIVLSATVEPAVSNLRSDRRRVEQILINLLNNAVKFTATGSVVLEVERVTTDAMPTDSVEALRFRISDTGIGMHPEDLATLFLPFRQLDNGLTRQHEGTGLGLAICHRLVELLGGRIDVTSVWATGSVFSVTLPLQRSPAP